MGKACRGKTKKSFSGNRKTNGKVLCCWGCSLGHTLIENPLAITIVTYTNNFWSLFWGTDCQCKHFQIVFEHLNHLNSSIVKRGGCDGGDDGICRN